MRFFNSLRNSTLAFIGQIVTILLGFVLRWYFIHTLGSEFLGVNSVMESVLLLLAMTELGIGTSIAFALYKPIENSNEKKIATLMFFYRKAYHFLGILTAAIGFALIPFVRFFTKDVKDIVNVNLVYVVFLANTVLSYFFSYKRTLISAYQQNYIVTVSEDVMTVIKYILQGIAIIVFKSYIAYILINLICSFLTNFIISSICDKKFPINKKYKDEKLTTEDKSILKKSVISLMFQKIAGSLVMGTDNLMISYGSIALMGVYSNYSMVISIIDRVITNVVNSIVGSVGNLMVQNDEDYKYGVYEELVFATFCCFFFIASVLSGCLERFIGLWAGADWVLSPKITFIVIMNFLLQGSRLANFSVIDTTGVFNKLKLKAAFEVIINLVASFLFLIVFDMGIYGVLLGTTVSKVGICIWWEAYAVHKYSFGRSGRTYTVKYMRNVLTSAAGCFAAYYISHLLPFEGFGGLVLSGITSSFVFAVTVVIVFFKTAEFKGLLERVVKLKNQFLKKEA